MLSPKTIPDKCLTVVPISIPSQHCKSLLQNPCWDLAPPIPSHPSPYPKLVQPMGFPSPSFLFLWNLVIPAMCSLSSWLPLSVSFAPPLLLCSSSPLTVLFSLLLVFSLLLSLLWTLPHSYKTKTKPKNPISFNCPHTVSLRVKAIF